MEAFASTPLSLSGLQAAILSAVARYELTQARPVTVRDIYRRLRLEKNLTLETVRELKDMGLLNVTRITASNRVKVLSITTTDVGKEWTHN